MNAQAAISTVDLAGFVAKTVSSAGSALCGVLVAWVLSVCKNEPLVKARERVEFGSLSNDNCIA